MKFFGAIIVPLLLFGVITAEARPILQREPLGAVNDFGEVMSAEAEGAVEGLCRRLLAQTGVALVVATTESLDGHDIDETANRLFEKWRIGGKGRDEGILVLVAVEERRIRIETGYGTEGYITDAVAAQIIGQVARPPLAAGRWDSGIAATAVALSRAVAREKGVPFERIAGEASAMPGDRSSAEEGGNALGFLVILFAILLLFGTRPGRAVLPWLILSGMTSSRRSYGGFGGGFGGRGFGGGFGGFGGGMSGGGGAGGSF